MTNFFFLNTVTQCDKHLFKDSDIFFNGKFIFRKNQKIWLPLKNKFQHRRKISLEYLQSNSIMFEKSWKSNFQFQIKKKKFGRVGQGLFLKKV